MVTNQIATELQNDMCSRFSSDFLHVGVGKREGGPMGNGAQGESGPMGMVPWGNGAQGELGPRGVGRKGDWGPRGLEVFAIAT